MVLPQLVGNSRRPTAGLQESLINPEPGNKELASLAHSHDKRRQTPEAVEISAVDKQLLDKLALAVILAVLVSTAPDWLNPNKQHQSQYDAPWIYPGLAPQEH